VGLEKEEQEEEAIDFEVRFLSFILKKGRDQILACNSAFRTLLHSVSPTIYLFLICVPDLHTKNMVTNHLLLLLWRWRYQVPLNIDNHAQEYTVWQHKRQQHKRVKQLGISGFHSG
jgi:hypothetical protein